MLVRASLGRAPLFVVIVGCFILIGCKGACTSVNDCYNESLGSESAAKLDNATVAWVERYTDNGHPVSYGARLLNLDYSSLEKAGGAEVVLNPPDFKPTDPMRKIILGERVDLRKADDRVQLILRVRRVQGDDILLAVPAGQIVQRKTFSGHLVRPTGATGWYPQRYCVSSAENDGVASTTIAADEFALPGRPPPAGADPGVPDDVDGC